jgi:hypothetical protein
MSGDAADAYAGEFEAGNRVSACKTP